MSRSGARKADAFDDHGIKIRSQHSIFGPARRVAGPAGNAPSWQESVIRSWNRYERRDRKKRLDAHDGAFGLPSELVA